MATCTSRTVGRRPGCANDMQADIDQILVDLDAVGAQEEHNPLFPGTIRYVTTAGDDADDGLTPNTSMLTWGAAIAASSPGDAISVKAGTYTETGLDVNVAGLQLWSELGVVLDPASGTALTISANFCKIEGEHKVTPAAGAIGILVSGDECVVNSAKVLTGATGVRVTGSGVILNDCASGMQTSVAYDLQGAQGRLYRCKTVGNAATTGYKISNGADTGVLEQCTSVGHAASGFYIDTGSQDWTLLGCSSGAGDGRWVDVDSANVWTDFRYAAEVVKLTTFAGIPTTYNIFKVTGAVRVSDIHGHVETAIPNTASNVHLELYSANGPIDITLGPGVDIDQAVAGALLVRNGASTDALDLADPNSLPAVAENTTWKDPKTTIDVLKDDSALTYIRLVLSVALASGAIHWHAHWEPLSDDGFLEPA